MLFNSIEDVAKLIDHTNLKPMATQQQIETLCKEAEKYKFKTVCINPFWVPFVSAALERSKVQICTVVGFPLGANATAIKVNEAKTAVQQGAHEVDMVVNLSAFKSKDNDQVHRDIEAVVDGVKPNPVKTILEICYLNENEIRELCMIAKQAGAAYVKTSTGFGPSGATVEAVKLMRKTVGHSMGVKAAGGIRTYSALYSMVDAGATRIGTSAGVQIITEASAELSEPTKRAKFK